MAGLTFNEYQKKAKKTAVYNGQGELLGFAYVVVGAGGELGELMNIAAKIMRGDHPISFYEGRLINEIGGVLWFLSQICEEAGLRLGDCANSNLDLLCARLEAGTIKGDGDGVDNR